MYTIKQQVLWFYKVNALVKRIYYTMLAFIVSTNGRHFIRPIYSFYLEVVRRADRLCVRLRNLEWQEI